jgi:hypothetical protein
MGEYHKRKYLFVPELQLLFVFEHDLDETVTIAKRLNASRIVTSKGTLISAAELLVSSIVN